MCMAAPKPPPMPPPPAPPPIKMTERIRPSLARVRSRRAAAESTSALAIPLAPDAGVNIPR